MPIGDLYKTQVYQVAAHLGVPQEIIDRTPTTDTYTAEQTQQENSTVRVFSIGVFLQKTMFQACGLWPLSLQGEGLG